MATSFSGERSRSTRREPPTMGMQLVNLSLVAAKLGVNPCHIGDRLVTQLPNSLSHPGPAIKLVHLYFILIYIMFNI
jgi:hypothetical protein